MSDVEKPSLTNHAVAGDLREAADLLEEQGASTYRTGAYRRAADLVEALGEPVAAIVAREGSAGLRALPGIGPTLASAIAEIVQTGHWSRLERYRVGDDPVARLRSVPGLGATLARRIYDALRVETLEELEAAALDGRLERVAGVGAKRAKALAATLATLLGHAPPNATAA